MHLFLATPTMHQMVSAGYSKTVAAVGMVCAKHNIQFSLAQADTMFIVDARNKLVEQFLANQKHTHMLMVDSDSELGFAAVEKIITCGFPFASLPFCQRQIDLTVLWEAGIVGSKFESALASSLTWCLDLADNNQNVVDGWVKARRTGFGCVLLQRHVLEAFSGGWFDRLPEGDIILSEDMSFCERVKDVATPMLCVDQLTHHNGTFSFGARMIDDQRFFRQNTTP